MGPDLQGPARLCLAVVVMMMTVMVVNSGGECRTCGGNQQEQQGSGYEFHEANVARFARV